MYESQKYDECKKQVRWALYKVKNIKVNNTVYRITQ